MCSDPGETPGGLPAEEESSQKQPQQGSESDELRELQLRRQEQVKGLDGEEWRKRRDGQGDRFKDAG